MSFKDISHPELWQPLRHIYVTRYRLRKSTIMHLVSGLSIKGAQMEMASPSSAIFVVVLAMISMAVIKRRIFITFLPVINVFHLAIS